MRQGKAALALFGIPKFQVHVRAGSGGIGGRVDLFVSTVFAVAVVENYVAAALMPVGVNAFQVITRWVLKSRERPPKAHAPIAVWFGHGVADNEVFRGTANAGAFKISGGADVDAIDSGTGRVAVGMMAKKVAIVAVADFVGVKSP